MAEFPGFGWGEGRWLAGPAHILLYFTRLMLTASVIITVWFMFEGPSEYKSTLSHLQPVMTDASQGQFSLHRSSHCGWILFEKVVILERRNYTFQL